MIHDVLIAIFIVKNPSSIYSVNLSKFCVDLAQFECLFLWGHPTVNGVVNHSNLGTLSYAEVLQLTSTLVEFGKLHELGYSVLIDHQSLAKVRQLLNRNLLRLVDQDQGNSCRGSCFTYMSHGDS